MFKAVSASKRFEAGAGSADGAHNTSTDLLVGWKGNNASPTFGVSIGFTYLPTMGKTGTEQ